MTEHISTSRLQRFRVRALPTGELASIADHVDACPSCHQQFVEMLRSRRGSEPLKITLAPEFQLRLEHVDYEQLVRLADKTIDGSEREMLDKETDSSSAIIEPKPTREKAQLVWWRGLAWKPASAADALVIAMALV